MKLVTVSEMRSIEQEASEKGLSFETMIDNAGVGLAGAILAEYGSLADKTILGLVGTGNNGGDTLVALAKLAKAGWRTGAYLVGARPKKDALLRRLEESGGEVRVHSSDAGLKTLAEWLPTFSVLLDGILGIGLKLPLKAEIGEVLQQVTKAGYAGHVVAVDCPSGVDCETGKAATESLAAELTVCMAAVKAGLMKFPANNLAGRLRVVDIGLTPEVQAWQQVKTTVAENVNVRELLPLRPRDAHKGTFGTVMVAAGSTNYTGAALLAGRAAYFSGAGLVRMAVPGPLHAPLAGHLPEATWLLLPHEMGVIAEEAAEVVLNNLEHVTALVVGPGLGQEETTAGFMRKLLEARSGRADRAGIGFVRASPVRERETGSRLPPLIVDADGLRLLGKNENWPRLLPPESILTPHPGEMAVLTGLAVEEIQKNRLENARSFARQWGQVVVLKGALTVVAEPGGRATVIPVASAALARAGTGDVLAGLIGGLRGQGLSGYDAAVTGAWLHAQAGLEAARRAGSEAAVLAGDVLQAVPAAVAMLASG